MKIFVVIGLQRTGTTLLASMLGRHPDINMLFESVTNDSLKLIGKNEMGFQFRFLVFYLTQSSSNHL